MRNSVAVGVLALLVGAFSSPNVVHADDCSGLADCFATVESAVATLLGGGLVLAVAFWFLTGGGRGRTGERAETGAADAASAPSEAPRPSEPGSRPGDRETTTPPGRRDIKLYPPGGPAEQYTDITTKDGDVIHSETKPDGSMSGSLERPDGTRVEADRRPDGSQTERHYGGDGQLVGTREIGPDKSSTYTTPPVTNPDGSVSQSKANYGPDGTITDYETNIASPDGTTTTQSIYPDGSRTAQTNYPDSRGSTTVTQPDGTTTERNFNPDGSLVSEETKTPPGSSHFDKL